VSRARSASPPDRSSALGGRGSVSNARCPDGQWLRSRPGAGASAAQASTRSPVRRSGAELRAPLGPTTSEHAASALRGHPGSEAMLALPRALLGLIRPLHGCVPVPRSCVHDADRQTHERLAFRQPCVCERVTRLALRAILVVGRCLGQTRGRPRHDPDDRRSPAGPRPARRSRTTGSERWLGWWFGTVGGGKGAGGPDSLPRRLGRCYSGPTPRPGPPRKHRPIGSGARTHRPFHAPRTGSEILD
jgi:hypothetical protein